MVYAVLGISIEKIVIKKIVFNKKLHRYQRNVDLPEKGDRLLRAALVSPSMHRFITLLKSRRPIPTISVY